MEHLNLETLARLVDERPNPQERDHLASCSECAAELRALKMQTDNLAALPALRPPQGDWHALEARLLAEGLLQNSSETRRPLVQRLPGWAQAAAAVALFLAGTGVGLAVAEPAAPIGTGSLALEVETVDEALELVEATERDYMAALVKFNQLGRTDADLSEQDQYERLAALEGLMTASQQAVQMVPSDPAFNGFLANVVAERQSALRTISMMDGGAF